MPVQECQVGLIDGSVAVGVCPLAVGRVAARRAQGGADLGQVPTVDAAVVIGVASDEHVEVKIADRRSVDSKHLDGERAATTESMEDDASVRFGERADFGTAGDGCRRGR